MEQQYNVADVVWARARKPKSEIFWPAQVVETEKTPRSKKKVIASVKFLGEDTYEDVKDAKDIMKWDCNKQLIQIGRASLENEKPQKRICFNKGVREAKKLFAGIGEKEIDRTNKTLDEPTTSSKGNNSSNIKFVDDSITVPIVKQQISKTVTNENDRNAGKKNQKTTSGKKDNRTGSCKISNPNDKKEVKTNEPKVQCFRNVTACENLVRRSSPRKQARRDSTATAKDISNEKGTSTQFVANTSNDEMKTDIDTKISPASSRKRKREEKSKEKALECKDETLSDSKSPVKIAKKERKNDAKQKESTDIQKNKGSVEKRPIPNHGTDSNSCRMKEENTAKELENDSCSDDEFMETALSPNSNNYKFELGDVVWAKLYREPFWPAQVKRISCTKPRKIYVQFLGYDNKYCFYCRRLFPFACDSGKRDEFMKGAQVLDPQRFEIAFTMAEDLVRRKALGIKDQKEEEEEEGCSLVDTDEVKENGNDGEESTSSVADDEPQKEADVRQLSRSVKRPSKYKDILTYIREAKPFLKEIFEEKRDCERHQIFKTGSAKDKNSLKRRSGFGPVTDSDLENDIMELLQEYYRELVGSKEDFSEITYISDVWLPEAIIYALQKIENVDRRAAEFMFQRGSSEETQIHRFTQQLKAKTLTQEEKEESLQRAQQCFRASAS